MFFQQTSFLVFSWTNEKYKSNLNAITCLFCFFVIKCLPPMLQWPFHVGKLPWIGNFLYTQNLFQKCWLQTGYSPLQTQHITCSSRVVTATTTTTMNHLESFKASESTVVIAQDCKKLFNLLFRVFIFFVQNSPAVEQGSKTCHDFSILTYSWGWTFQYWHTHEMNIDILMRWILTYSWGWTLQYWQTHEDELSKPVFRMIFSERVFRQSVKITQHSFNIRHFAQHLLDFVDQFNMVAKIVWKVEISNSANATFIHNHSCMRLQQYRHLDHCTGFHEQRIHLRKVPLTVKRLKNSGMKHWWGRWVTVKAHLTFLRRDLCAQVTNRPLHTTRLQHNPS